MSLQKNNSNFTIYTRTIHEVFGRQHDINYEIPLYQRQYKWGKDEIISLLEDIEERKNDEDEHFFGVIATSKQDEGDVFIRRVIDGQQRLTSSILIINTLIKKIKEKKQIMNMMDLKINIQKLNLVMKYQIKHLILLIK